MLMTHSHPHNLAPQNNVIIVKQEYTGRVRFPLPALTTFSKPELPRYRCVKLFNHDQVDWSSWMGCHRHTTNLKIQGGLSISKRKLVHTPGHAINCSRKTGGRSILTAFSGKSCNSWLSKFYKHEKLIVEGDKQRAAVLNVHFRLSLSEPKNPSDFLGIVTPRWIKLLKGVQPWIPQPPQDGGGGNKNGNLNRHLSYGGDDESDHEKGMRRSSLFVYQWWFFCIAFISALVWALGTYSGVPQRTQISVSQFVDCVLWLGLMWCLATFFLWTARIVVSLIPVSFGHNNGWSMFRSNNALSSSREFLVGSKFDEWMAQNVVAVPGLVISLFLISDLIHYGKNLGIVPRFQSDMVRMFDLMKLSVVGVCANVPRRSPILMRGDSAEKKRRRGFGSSSRRPRP